MPKTLAWAWDVAVKVLPEHLASDPTALTRFEQGQVGCGPRAHPNILVLFDAGEQEGIRYAVTELLEGDSP